AKNRDRGDQSRAGRVGGATMPGLGDRSGYVPTRRDQQRKSGKRSQDSTECEGDMNGAECGRGTLARARHGVSMFRGAALNLMIWSVTLAAQTRIRPDSNATPLILPVGSVAENYLRYAQTLGELPLSAWTIRPMTPPEVDRFAARASA